MSWGIEEQGGAVLVTMTSNPVNKMNAAFFDDLNEALEALDQRFPRLPVVLTAQGGTFSAGLDFADVFPRFARGDIDEVMGWFDRFKPTVLRVFTSPRRTVAAVNGNAFAGGLILALSCDVRIGAAGESKLAINEVPVGIPMPATFAEIVRYAIGDPRAAEAILSGRIYDVRAAVEVGFLHMVVPADSLVETALAEARRISPDCASAYATSKRILHHPTMQRLESATPELDREAMRTVILPDSVRAQQAAFDRLKRKT